MPGYGQVDPEATRGRHTGVNEIILPPHYARHRFPAEVNSHAAWLYFRFPLNLRMVVEMLAARGIEVSHETVRQ
jgi:transposase-like protein